jgi:glutamine synthetase
MKYSNEVEQWLKENNVEEVECLIPDITGNARGKFIPAKKFVKEDSRLPESILAQTVTGDFAEEHDEFMDPLDIDMLLEPDPTTMRMVPWAKEPTAQIIHDCFRRDGTPHPISTRNVLKRVLKLYEDNGWTPVIAPEMEFYLIERNLDPDTELAPPIGRSGRAESARQSYSIDATNEFDSITELMYAYCEAQELDVDTLIHESGAAQMEINFQHGDPLSLADQVFTFKRTMREAALQNDIYATFMAKPMEDEPGSSMHIHQSVLDTATGKNIFTNDDDSESDLFRWFIGGHQKYVPHLISLFAPNVNSYRRFTKDQSAPINMEWGYDNRTAGLRIPHSSPAARRLENRFPGADANPYLAIAASLASGILGIINKVEPSTACTESAYDKDITISRTLNEALLRLDDIDEIKELLGEEFITAYIHVKNEEYNGFNKVISSWEREFLLLNV